MLSEPKGASNLRIAGAAAFAITRIQLDSGDRQAESPFEADLVYGSNIFVRETAAWGLSELKALPSSFVRS
jgi:hypothetical protein